MYAEFHFKKEKYGAFSPRGAPYYKYVKPKKAWWYKYNQPKSGIYNTLNLIASCQLSAIVMSKLVGIPVTGMTRWKLNSITIPESAHSAMFHVVKVETTFLLNSGQFIPSCKISSNWPVPYNKVPHFSCSGWYQETKPPTFPQPHVQISL